MAQRLPHLRHLEPPIESIEVGRLAEAEQALAGGDPRKAYSVLHQLVWEAGKIAVAGLLLKIDPELDVVTLEELSRNWLKDSNTTLRKKVIRYLALGGAGGSEAQTEFQDRIRAYGKQRLLLLLNLEATDDVTAWLFRGEGTAAQKALTELRRTTDTALQAIDDLGLYIGDLLALLYLTRRMHYAVLGGGVLSQTSGSLACKAAVKRLNTYNDIDTQAEDFAGNLSIRFAIDETSKVGVSFGSANLQDPGTCGAALAGALELLRQKRLEGLKLVIGMVHQLELMDTLEITSPKVKKSRKKPGEKDLYLRQYALDADQVKQHLDQAAPQLGLVRTLTNDKKRRYTYTRWPAG